MIAIGTNVLLRYLLADDAIQTAKATNIINSSEKILVTDVVLVETLWTLKGKKYQASKEDLVSVVESLFKEPHIVFEDGATVWRALHDFRLSVPVKVGSKNKSADFSDALIVNKAQTIAKKLQEPLDGIYTFDVAARALEGTKEP